LEIGTYRSTTSVTGVTRVTNPMVSRKSVAKIAIMLLK
jgi:hypothetical protein